jgi:hypothetical protein
MNTGGASRAMLLLANRVRSLQFVSVDFVVSGV